MAHTALSSDLSTAVGGTAKTKGTGGTAATGAMLGPLSGDYAVTVTVNTSK